MLNNLKWYLQYYVDRYAEQEPNAPPFSPRKFELDRIKFIQEGDALRNKGQVL